MKIKVGYMVVVLALAAGLLAGCGTAATTETNTSVSPEESGGAAQSASSEAGTGAVPVESYENALPVSSQLALGTLLLDEAGNGVTPQQAESLLPLWQVIQSGTLQGEAETGALMQQIERAMTEEQIAAIAAMQLTMEDMGAWAQESGVSLGGPGGSEGGVRELPEGMSEEDMEAMRAAREAGEGGFGPPEGLSEADREAMRATAEASGITRPEGGGSGGGQFDVLVQSLVRQLTQLAGEQADAGS